jgi:hypothetical protein
LIDGFLDKIEELVDRSETRIRADVVHDRIVVMGFTGDERTTRRAVAEMQDSWRAGIVAVTGPGCLSRVCGASSTGVTGPT